YAESTPNPAVLKFVANRQLVATSYEFVSTEDAKHSALATELFHLPFVKSVFFDENFISVTKSDVADWSEITSELREFIRQFIESGNEIISADAAKSSKKTDSETRVKFEDYDDISK